MSDFNTLFSVHGYDAFMASLDAAASVPLAPYIGGGKPVPEEHRRLVQADALYPLTSATFTYWGTMPGYLFYGVSGTVGGSLPFRGVLGVPSNPTRTIVLMHGMGSTPLLSFGAGGTDYMQNIGHRLTSEGYLVWAPFMPQAGNFPSMAKTALSMARNGVSHLAYILSLFEIAPQLFANYMPNAPAPALYGMSMGAYYALQSALITPPPAMVISGYMREESRMPFDPASVLASGAVMPFLMNPDAAAYSMPAIFERLTPVPTFFEVGSTDASVSVAAGRDVAFAAAQTAFGLPANDVVLGVFPGGHEVHGTAAMQWLATKI